MSPHHLCWLTLVVVALALTGACSSETVARPPPPPMNWQSFDPRAATVDAGRIAATPKERGVADAYTKALGSPRFALLGPLLHEDAHFAFAGYKDVHGRDLVILAHEALLGQFEPRAFVPTRVLLTDNSQAIEWTMTGVHKATQKPVGFRGLTLLWTRDDGSLSDIHLYFDEAVVKTQLGVGPKGMLAVPVAPSPQAVGQASGGRPEIEQADTSDEKANVAKVGAALEALETGDDAAYLATMTDDVEITGLASIKPLRGKGDARAYFKATRTAIGQLDTQVDNAWGIGSFAVVEYHIVGEQRGPIGWIPAQRDTLLKMFVVDVVEMRGDKIARIWRYENPGQIFATHEEVHK